MVAPVAVSVLLDLGFPSFAQLVTPSRKPPAMPEGSIHEDSDPVPPENEIGPAWEIARLRLDTESGIGEQLGHSALGTGITPSNSRHDPGAGRRIHDVAAVVTFTKHGNAAGFLVFSTWLYPTRANHR